MKNFIYLSKKKSRITKIDYYIRTSTLILSSTNVFACKLDFTYNLNETFQELIPFQTCYFYEGNND